MKHPYKPLPLSLSMEDANSTDMKALVDARVDLRQQPTGRLRCGVSSLAALRVSKHAPRANAGVKKRAADREVWRLWISDPGIPDVWFGVWVTPGAWQVARYLEVHGSISPHQRDHKLVEGVGQRVSDLRALGVVIDSTWAENPRGLKAPKLVEHTLLSGLRTELPTTEETKGGLFEFAGELQSLVALPAVEEAVLAEIDAHAEARRRSAIARLRKGARWLGFANP